MKYEIRGENFPVAICQLQAGEAINCEAGAMSWMDPCIKMETKSGGIGKMLGRALSKETLFLNRFVAESDGEIAFSACTPGMIIPVEIGPGKNIIAQKGAFMAAEEGVDLDIFFQKKIGSGLFGGEGFVMQKLSGQGTALLEIDGGIVEYELAPGQQKIIDSGYLVMMDETCSIDIVMIKGVTNVLFGGEGMFNTVITGPGKIVIQTMPMVQMVSDIAELIQRVNK